MSYKLSTWNLKELFPAFNSPEFESAFDQIEEQVASFEGVRGKLRADIPVEEFLQAVRASEESMRVAYKLYAFAGLSFTADTQDQIAQTAQNRVNQFFAEISNRTLFFNLWWKQVDEENAKRLMSASGDYRYYLEAIRLYKPHTLSEAEEKIVNLKDVTGSNALINLYDAITNRYMFKFKVDGKVKEITGSELSGHRYSTDPKIRAKAYQELFRVYAEQGPVLGQMYQTRVRDWHNENIKLRNFKTPISARNLGNDIPDEAVDVLLDVARKNSTIFQKYFKLKAKHIGIKKLRRYDLYAPVAGSKKTYSFDNASQMILESFSAFSPEVGKMAQRVFDENHMDSEIRKGKLGGAFCWSVVPEMTPYVLMNYQGSAREVATLAHELGHAIHSMLASQHTAFTFQASLPLAETASTFGELMLVDKMLTEEKDEDVRRELLFRDLDDSYATIMRQAFFCMFEKTAHDLVMKNASVDELCAASLQNLQEQFGDSVEISDEFKWEWVSIPHFYHTPFYVYAYAFGKLLVLSLYKQYKAEGESFKPKYLKILAAGGSESPERILTEAGIDIRSAKFWQGGFDVIAEQVKALENL